jgi:hypothetical protein
VAEAVAEAGEEGGEEGQLRQCGTRPADGPPGGAHSPQPCPSC